MAAKLDALTYSLIDIFEGDDHSDAEIFHESTKITRRNQSTLSRRTDFISRDPQLVLMMSRGWKSYAGCETIPLPSVPLGPMPLEDALHLRRSTVGRYSGEAISFEQLSALLRYSYGITQRAEIGGLPGEPLMLRAAPSAGGLYPLEVYPLVLNVDGCEPGIYHYSVEHNALEVLQRGQLRSQLLEMISYRNLAETASVFIAITAVFPRTIAKYLFRGYRFISYDVGVLLQNLYLVGTALHLGTCAVGGFYDNEVSDLLQIDNVDESIMMLFAVGRTITNGQPQHG